MIKFDPLATTFNLNNALYLANICKIVDKGYSEIEEDVQLLDIKYKFFDKRDIQALIVYDSDKVIITFRSTEPQNIRDWITNLRCRKTRYLYGNGLIHSGFEKGIADIYDYLYCYLTKIKSEVKNRRIWLTGYSQGGALATLLPMWLKNTIMLSEYDIAGGYTFGSPRVGNKEFAREFTKNFGDRWYRIVNCSDYITRIPRRILHYKHVPENGKFEPCYYFDEDGKLFYPYQSYSLWKRFWDRVEGGFEGIINLELSLIEHHKLDNYIKNLENSIKRDF